MWALHQRHYAVPAGSGETPVASHYSRCSPCGGSLDRVQRVRHQWVVRESMASGRARVGSTPATPGPVIHRVRHEEGSLPLAQRVRRLRVARGELAAAPAPVHCPGRSALGSAPSPMPERTLGPRSCGLVWRHAFHCSVLRFRRAFL